MSRKTVTFTEAQLDGKDPVYTHVEGKVVMGRIFSYSGEVVKSNDQETEFESVSLNLRLVAQMDRLTKAAPDEDDKDDAADLY